MSTSWWLEVLKITEKIIRENAFEHKKNKPGLSANRPSNNWVQKCKDHFLRPPSRPRDHFEHHFFHSVCTGKWRAKQAVKELIPRARVSLRVSGSRVNSRDSPKWRACSPAKWHLLIYALFFINRMKRIRSLWVMCG